MPPYRSGTARVECSRCLEKCCWPSACWKMLAISIEYRIECSPILHRPFVLSLFLPRSTFHSRAFIATSLMWKTNFLIGKERRGCFLCGRVDSSRFYEILLCSKTVVVKFKIWSVICVLLNHLFLWSLILIFRYHFYKWIFNVTSRWHIRWCPPHKLIATFAMYSNYAEQRGIAFMIFIYTFDKIKVNYWHNDSLWKRVLCNKLPIQSVVHSEETLHALINVVYLIIISRE